MALSGEGDNDFAAFFRIFFRIFAEAVADFKERKICVLAGDVALDGREHSAEQRGAHDCKIEADRIDRGDKILFREVIVEQSGLFIDHAGSEAFIKSGADECVAHGCDRSEGVGGEIGAFDGADGNVGDVVESVDARHFFRKVGLFEDVGAVGRRDHIAGFRVDRFDFHAEFREDRGDFEVGNIHSEQAADSCIAAENARLCGLRFRNGNKIGNQFAAGKFEDQSRGVRSGERLRRRD